MNCRPVTNKIIEIFLQQGNKRYGVEPVTQLQHALQSATLANQESGDSQLTVSALLHDIGHIMDDADISQTLEQNLHDHHEHKAFHWILRNFGSRVADPVRLHVDAKRYLCTVEPDYIRCLSETSVKSFYDQGGPMSFDEKLEFESERYYKEAIRLRRWDDKAKDPNKETMNISFFIPFIEDCLLKNK